MTELKKIAEQKKINLVKNNNPKNMDIGGLVVKLRKNSHNQ
jgi:hypothetical protein